MEGNHRREGGDRSGLMKKRREEMECVRCTRSLHLTVNTCAV